MLHMYIQDPVNSEKIFVVKFMLYRAPRKLKCPNNYTNKIYNEVVPVLDLLL